MVTDKVFGDTLFVLTHELITVTRVVENTAGLDALIRPIWTVFVSVTFPFLRDTHVRRGTMERLGTARLSFALAAFVTTVPTVVSSVTNPAIGNTSMVRTLELRARAKLITVSLVRPVLTVVLLITRPAHGNTSTAGTRKEGSLALYLFVPLTVALIREVSTVVGSVTLPRRSVAQCGELTLLKGHSLHTQVEVTRAVSRSAVHLITGIITVHFLITFAGVGDAAAVPALELIGRAQSGVAEELV